MNERAFFGASLLASLIASLCCIGPLVFAALGVGAFSLARGFEALRPAFLGLTGVLLAFGFYSAYRQPAVSCEGEACAVSRYQRWTRPVLWVVTLLVVALALFPAWYGRLGAVPSAAQPRGGPSPPVTVELKVSGMTCAACATGLEKRLVRERGVQSAEVSLKAATARITYDPTKTDAAKLINAVNSTGFKASLPNSRKE